MSEQKNKSLVKGNVAMATSKFFSGFNENALRYLLPTWMSAWSGVAMRLGFGAIAFWIVGFFRRGKSTKITAKQKLVLLSIGFFLMFGYMSFLLLGLTYTTPVVSSIFISTEPVWVFILSVIFYHEHVTRGKILGIVLGLGGALLCILTTQDSDVASRPWLGAFYCFIDAVIYSIYLIVSKRVLKGIDNITVSKWSFLGGAISSGLVVLIAGWHAPVLHEGLFSTPMLALLFVLIFPSTVSYFLLDIGINNLKPTVVAIYGYVILIVATITSYILGQDHFSWWQMVAIAMIVASVYYVEIAERRDSEASSQA